MTSSHTVAEWATTYEQKNKKKPTESVIRVVERIEEVCGILTNIGRKDAHEGKEPFPSEYFNALVVKVFRMDSEKDREMVQIIGKLWQSEYMRGYQKGGAV